MTPFWECPLSQGNWVFLKSNMTTNNSEMLIEAAKFRSDRLSINSTAKLELKKGETF